MAGEIMATPDSRKNEPHVTPLRLAKLHRGVFGEGDFVLNEGRKFDAEIISNNVIRIYDGSISQGGIRGEIEQGDYRDVQLENGINGMKRHDIIVCRWATDATNSIITNQVMTVVKGTSVQGTPTDPQINTALIEEGATIHDTALYRVKFEGLNVVSVEPMFDVLYNMSEIKGMFAELNSKLLKVLKTVNIEIEIPPCSSGRPIHYNVSLGKNYPNAKYFVLHHTYNVDWVTVFPSSFAFDKSQVVVQMYNYYSGNLKGALEIVVVGQD